MKNFKIGLISFLMLLFAYTAHSQHISDLRLNEMLIENVDNYIDEYGRHVPWIEVFNTAYNDVNVAECYLTNDTTGLADGSGVKNWYRIPKGDPKTLIKQRSFLVFYLDNAPLYGTFHVNFDPRDESASNYVALISSNARTLIDIFEFPDSLRRSTAHSYGCIDDGDKEKMGFLEYFTPASTNKVEEGLTKSEKMAQQDPRGWGLALISVIVVFSALIIIFLILKLFGIMNNRKKATKTSAGELSGEASSVEMEEGDLNGEELAAITTALHLHFGLSHDMESEIITIETPSAHYSPWSQKHLLFKRVDRVRRK